MSGPEFNLDDPVLPKAIRKAALGSGGYPYDDRMDDEDYLTELRKLQL